MRRAIVDTGPLVAFPDRAEQHHSWVIEQSDELQAPPLVCARVLAQAMRRGRKSHVSDAAETMPILAGSAGDFSQSTAG
jgi:hypothetical protein